MQAVELTLAADGVHHLRADIVVGKPDLDSGAGRRIAVQKLRDGGDVIGLHRLVGARLLIDEQDSHARSGDELKASKSSAAVRRSSAASWYRPASATAGAPRRCVASSRRGRASPLRR